MGKLCCISLRFWSKAMPSAAEICTLFSEQLIMLLSPGWDRASKKWTASWSSPSPLEIMHGHQTAWFPKVNQATVAIEWSAYNRDQSWDPEVTPFLKKTNQLLGGNYIRPLTPWKGQCFSLPNGHVLHGFAFPACRALEWGHTDWLVHWHGVLINSKRIYPTAADYGSGGMTMLPIGATAYRTTWKMTTREASWRHTEASAWKLYAVRMGCQSSGYDINFKPMAIICYCVSNRWNAWIWGEKGRI